MPVDPVLAQIAEEAQRLTRAKCAIRIQGDVAPALVIELPGDSIVRGRWLHKRLGEFCERGGLAKRYLVVGGTVPGFVSETPPLPDGWPAEPADG